MTIVKYNNRYGDAFTFTKTEDGNILWEGNFEWCRCGWPNVYDEAYKAYNEDNSPNGPMKLEEFKIKVHEYNYDTNAWTMDKKYQQLIFSDKNKIDMVDPSGGPYICQGFGMEVFDKSFKGMIVEEFKRIETGYKIIIKK